MQVSDSPFVTATVEFSACGADIRANIPVPAGPARPSDLLPACRAVSGAIVDLAVEQTEMRGERVSCKAGCGACCRQLVPVSEPEARTVHSLVESMPEPRRSAVLQRFQEAKERLRSAGYLDLLADSDRFPYSGIQQFALEYFQLGIPCPFLESESCSIYDERPLICREYLVTSPAELCSRPQASTIRMVPLPTRVSSALLRVGLRPGAIHVRWTPLILALDWVASHPEEETESTGPHMIQELFARLAERRDESHKSTERSQSESSTTE